MERNIRRSVPFRLNKSLARTIKKVCHPERRASSASASRRILVLKEHRYFVYILTNVSRRPLYVGFTNGLDFRHWQHKEAVDPTSFTARYNLKRLVYFEEYRYVNNALSREKQLKRWTRVKKIELIESMNPAWDDLAVRFEYIVRQNQNQDPSTRSASLRSPHVAQDDKSGTLVRKMGSGK